MLRDIYAYLSKVIVDIMQGASIVVEMVIVGDLTDIINYREETRYQ